MKRIIQLIKKSGLRKDFIAKKLGMNHPQYLYMILKGKRKPKNLPDVKRRILEIVNR